MRTKSPQSPSPSPLLLRPALARKFLGVGKNKLLALLKAGAIRAKMQDGRRYFVTASLAAYVESLPDAH